MKKNVILFLLSAHLFGVQDGGWLKPTSLENFVEKIEYLHGDHKLDLPISQASLLQLGNAEIWNRIQILVDNILNSQDDQLKALRGQPMLIEEILNLLQIYGTSIEIGDLRHLADLCVANICAHNDLTSLHVLYRMINLNLISVPIEYEHKLKSILEANWARAEIEPISFDFPANEDELSKLMMQAETDPDRLKLELEDPNYIFVLGLSNAQKNDVLAHLYLQRAASMGIVEAKQQIEILLLKEKLKLCLENLQLTQDAKLHQQSVQIIETRLLEIKAKGDFFTAFQVDVALLEYYKKAKLDVDKIRKNLLAGSALGFKYVIAELGNDEPSEMIQAGIFFKAKDYFELGMIKQTDFGDSAAAGLAKLAIIDCALRKNIAAANLEGCMSNITDLNSVLKKGNGKHFFTKFNFIDQFHNIRQIDFPKEQKHELMMKIGLICLDNNQRSKGLDFLKASGLEQSEKDQAKFTLAVLELENADGDISKACQQLLSLILLKNDFNSIFFCCTNYHLYQQQFSPELNPVELAIRADKKIQELARELARNVSDSSCEKSKLNILSNALLKFIKFNELHKLANPKISKIIQALDNGKSFIEKFDEYCLLLGQIYLEQSNEAKCDSMIDAIDAMDKEKGQELRRKLQIERLPGTAEYNEAVSLTQTIFINPRGVVLQPDEDIKKQVDDEALRLVKIASSKGHLLAKLAKALWTTGKSGERFVHQSMTDKLRVCCLEKALTEAQVQSSPLNDLEEFKSLERDAKARLCEIKSRFH